MQQAVVDEWGDVACTKAWANVADQDWESVLVCLGVTEPLLFAGWAARGEGGAPRPTAMAKTRLRLAFNAMRLKFGMELVDLLPPPAPPTVLDDDIDSPHGPPDDTHCLDTPTLGRGGGDNGCDVEDPTMSVLSDTCSQLSDPDYASTILGMVRET